MMIIQHGRNTAANMGFSAMLAEECILIVPFASQLHSQLNKHNQALEYSFSYLSLLSNSAGLKDHRIPAQQKAPALAVMVSKLFTNFMEKINWRQILMHFVAFWFLIYSFQTLSYLYNTNLIDTIRQSKEEDTINILTNNGTTTSDLVNFQLWTSTSGFIGLLVAFILSLLISIKRHWFLVNSLIAFIVTYFLYRYDLLGWTYLKKVFWYLGQKFNNSTLEFLFNGIILLTIGLLIFLLKRPNQFIENRNLATT